MIKQTYDVGDPSLELIQLDHATGSDTACTGKPPWDRDENLRSSLEAAGWRYAYLIGIVQPEIPEDAAMLGGRPLGKGQSH